MYYDNKSTFYIKQYGPVVIVLLISAFLITSGVYIYLKSANMLKTTAATQTVDAKAAENAQKTQTVQSSSIIPEDMNKLKPLQKSSSGNVTNISGDGLITAQINKEKISFYLIGIDYTKSPANVLETMAKDLQDKKIKIAFDQEKTEDSKIYAYLYIDDNTLYNEQMLKKGMATLRSERKNVSMLDVLLDAEKTARVNFIGLWN